MWNLYKFLLKWTFIIGIVLTIVIAIGLGVYSVVDPEGYRAYMAEIERNRKEEEDRQEAERIAEEERRANMWCENTAYDRYAKSLNERLTNHPIDKSCIKESYEYIDIYFENYHVFYKEFISDTGGPSDGKRGTWIILSGSYDGSAKKLSEEDKETIKVVFGLSDDSLSIMVKEFEKDSDNVTINDKVYYFGGQGVWRIDCKYLY